MPVVHELERVLADDAPLVEGLQKGYGVFRCRRDAAVSPVRPVRTDIRDLRLVEENVRYLRRGSSLGTGPT